ncbi:MAG: hypothetical protein ACJA2O_004595 [Candidatus Azotimanducaceae bacterium]|jgi:hypothetical protein
MLGVFLLANIGFREAPSFQTLSTDTLPSGLPHQIGLSFDESVTPLNQRSVLSNLQSTLIAGPNEKGLYTLEIHVPVDLPDAEFIETIRDIEGVKYAKYSQTHTRP